MESAKIKNSIQYILENYLDARNENLRGHTMGEYVRHEVVEIISAETNINLNKYLVVGSVGQGQWAAVPWISCYDLSITRTATLGYYIVYLFKADMSGVYISLNQGWTYFRDKYGTREGRIKVRRIASLIRDQLNTVPTHLREEEIDLATNNGLGKGYENGHIYGRYYELNNLPDAEEIIMDFQSLLISYQEIVHLMNGRTVKQFNDYLLLIEDEEFLEDPENREEKYQDIVNELAGDDGEVTKSKKNEGPRARKEPVIDKGGRASWPRSAAEAASALKLSNYKCSVDESHKTFKSKSTKKPFMELHHLIPMGVQRYFANDLDRIENIISLCPNCHRAIHHSDDDRKAEMIELIYKKTEDQLKEVRIEITLSDLKAAYKISLIK